MIYTHAVFIKLFGDIALLFFLEGEEQERLDFSE